MKKEEIIFFQGNAPCNKWNKTIVKLNELCFNLLPHPPLSIFTPPPQILSLCWSKKDAPGKKI